MQKQNLMQNSQRDYLWSSGTWGGPRGTHSASIPSAHLPREPAALGAGVPRAAARPPIFAAAGPSGTPSPPSLPLSQPPLALSHTSPAQVAHPLHRLLHHDAHALHRHHLPPGARERPGAAQRGRGPRRRKRELLYGGRWREHANLGLAVRLLRPPPHALPQHHDIPRDHGAPRPAAPPPGRSAPSPHDRPPPPLPADWVYLCPGHQLAGGAPHLRGVRRRVHHRRHASGRGGFLPAPNSRCGHGPLHGAAAHRPDRRAAHRRRRRHQVLLAGYLCRARRGRGVRLHSAPGPPARDAPLLRCRAQARRRAARARLVRRQPRGRSC